MLFVFCSINIVIMLVISCEKDSLSIVFLVH